jgi:hypothetical protein
MRTLASWGAFVVAVAAFSRLWQGVRAALDGDHLYGPLEALGWMALFLSAMGYLAFVIYAADRASGRTTRRIRLFDRVLDRAHQTAPRRASGGL